MASFSSTYPTQRPIFSLDASNAGRLDPRMTFSRADTPPTYAAPSAVHYWSNEKHLSSDNLLLQSSDFDTTWAAEGLLSTPSGGQTDPSGSTNGWTLTESSITGSHGVNQSINASGTLTYTVYAKQNAGTRYLTLVLLNNSYDWEGATFDLAGGSPTIVSGSSSGFTSVSATQAASGNGYYKCVLTATGSAAIGAYIYLASSTSAPSGTWGGVVYTGDSTSSIDIAFASLSTTGATDYNATTTQIHREYAPTLKSVATAGQPRFEYDPASDGQSIAKGILIESQSTNLLINSADFGGSWQIINATKSLEAIGPDGTLSAIAFREGTNSLEKRLLRYYGAGGGNVTISVYAKLMGNTRRLVIREANASGQQSVFDIATGTKVTGNGSIDSVGNGWYRCQLNFSSSNTTQAAGFYLIPADGGGYVDSTYAGDGYSGLLLALPQAEDQSFASSYISTGTSGSTATRAAESLSVTDSSLFDNGGGSLVVETENVGRAYYAAVLEDDSTSVYQDYVALTVRADNKARQTVNAPGSTGASDEFSAASTVGGSYFKIASRFAPNDFGVCIDGGTVSTDTTGAVPSNVDKLFIGWYDDGGRANAHIKRVAVYGEALSDTNLQALTS